MEDDYQNMNIHQNMEDDSLVGVISILSVTTLGYFTSYLSLYVIYVNDRISHTVKMYFYIEYVSKLVLISVNMFWAVPCILWHFEQDLPWLNYTSGFLVLSFNNTMNFAQAALAVNRFFALAKNGRYYRVVSDSQKLQVFLLLGFPMIAATTTFIPGNHSFFNPRKLSFDYESGEIGIVYQIGMQAVLPYTFWGTAIFLDGKLYFMLKKRSKSLHNSYATHAEQRLLWQMIAVHLSGIIGLVFTGAMRFANGWEDHASPLQTFFGITFQRLLMHALQGLNVIYFLRPPSKMKASAVTQTERSSLPPRTRVAN